MITWLTRMIGVWIVLILASCSGAPSPFKGTWVAAPTFREVDNSFCKARFTPQKGNNAYFAFFQLYLVNKGDEELTIDWNASRYLYDGNPQGVLVFEGMDPETIKNGTVPMETIAPGGHLERKLMPLRLIAWNPIKEETANSRGITPGMLPAGENGIRLSLQQAGDRVTIPFSVLLSLEKQP